MHLSQHQENIYFNPYLVAKHAVNWFVKSVVKLKIELKTITICH